MNRIAMHFLAGSEKSTFSGLSVPFRVNEYVFREICTALYIKR